MFRSRRETLESLGASVDDLDFLLEYGKNHFERIDFSSLHDSLPLDNDASIDYWTDCVEEATSIGVFNSLCKRIAQMNFPIEKGISETETYQAATRKGTSVVEAEGATGLGLDEPDAVELCLHATPAGKIPIIIARNRNDFVSLVRAFTCKNEPCTIPDSMGAAMIAGLSNWDRLNHLKQKWQEENPSDWGGVLWSAEFKRIRAQKELYQDKFIILSSSPYSNIPAADMEMSEDEWLELSLIIRKEHECTHYLTKRILGSMENKLHDELIADYMGIVEAAGCYKAKWFLRFLGLENYPDYRNGGRLENYFHDRPLSDNSFNVLQRLAINSSRNLELIDSRCRNDLSSSLNKTLLAIILTQYCIEELSSPETVDLICRQFFEIIEK